MGTNPWLSSELAAARVADVERAARTARLIAEARAAEAAEPRPFVASPRMRRVVARRVGELLIAAGSRLAQPEHPGRLRRA